jgi:DnaJ like chaperone protein
VWGKIIGGMAGFAMGGPVGGVVGAALGHAAEAGALGRFPGMPRAASFGPMPRYSARVGQRDQLFAVAVVVLAAKLSKCDGPVVRAEIDAFKRNFRIPPEAARDVGRLFDRARDSSDQFEPYATQLGQIFADSPGMLEDVLAGLFAIARADGPVNRTEDGFLQAVCHRFGLGAHAWDRARDGRSRQVRSSSDDEDPYGVLGVHRDSSDGDIRLAWRQLMRENHPDSLASRGVPAEFIARAGEKVARINAAWDRIKRERGL